MLNDRYEKIITILASLVLSVFGVRGCSSDKADHKYVISGFGIDLKLSPCLSTAIKTEVKQEEKANLGYCNGIVNMWNSFEINLIMNELLFKDV